MTRDTFTSNQWYDHLVEMERPSTDGYEITVIRAAHDIRVVEIEITTNHAETLAIFQRIADAYSYTRAALINHPETGFYIV